MKKVTSHLRLFCEKNPDELASQNGGLIGVPSPLNGAGFVWQFIKL
jgi:hypothetical protein